MSQHTYRFYDLFFTSIIILGMLFGIILSIIFSKSFKQNFLIPVDPLKKSFFQNTNLLVGQKSTSPKIEFENYPELSVPVKMTLGKLKKVENPYRPRLNLSFLEYDRIFENTHPNLGFLFNPRLNIEYEMF